MYGVGGIGDSGVGRGVGEGVPVLIQTVSQALQLSVLTLFLGVHLTLLRLQMPLGFMRKIKQNTYYKICIIPSNLSF